MANERKEQMRADITAQLEEYRKIQEECERIRKRIQDKRKDINELRKITFECVVKHDLTIIGQVNHAVETMNDMIDYYAKLVEKREVAERCVMELVDRVQSSEGRKILYLHYIEGVPIKKIASQMGMVERTVWKKQRMAVEEMMKMRRSE